MTGDHPLFDALERDRLARRAHAITDDIRHWFEPHAPQAPETAPATVETTTTTEDHMISLADLEGKIRGAVAEAGKAAAEFDNLDKAALAKFDAIQANPVTAEIFGALHVLLDPALGVDHGLIGSIGAGLVGLARAYAAPAQAAA